MNSLQANPLTMASTNEPLISPSTNKNTTILSCKAYSITLCIVSLICIATVITLQSVRIHHDFNPFQLSDLCTRSPDHVSCHAIVSGAVATVRSQVLVPNQILQILINQSLVQIDRTYVDATNIHRQLNDLTHRPALADCIHLLELSRDRLLDTASAMAAGAYTDARTWLSAVLTNHVTCLDGLSKGSSSPSVKAHLNSLSALASASLAVLNAVTSYDDDSTETVIEFPSWVVFNDRKLLQVSETKKIQANVTVAADGSGDYVSVQEAVDSAPDKGKSRYVIYVKKGIYKENVMVGKKKTNVMIVGDGMNSTVITGSLNVIDGSSTFNSSTLAAVGDGFILQDICIENTAGPEKHQAVALRVGADRSVINRCQLKGYQDTLYAHSLRQFYRDSWISGTVDFIFGNAAVVFQNCSLVARLPMKKQQNLVTAQGRTDPNQNTGTSIQNCQVIPSPDLVTAVPSILTYLGRPWKNFSRTVYMQSYLDNHIHPKGWLEWNGTFALDTLYYGEFENKGPGAGVAARVNWTGYNVITDPDVAKNFTVTELIQGGLWLDSTGVKYTKGL